MISRWPPVTRVSLATAWVLSRVRTLAASAWDLLTSLLGSRDLNWAMVSSTSSRAYQTASVGDLANSRIALRYRAPAASATRRVSASVKPLSRPATTRLATRRLTSHSNGPGSVSSKSLTSKTSRRSGEANAPKLDRCASPHSCARSPDAGVVARSAAIGSAAPRKKVNGDTSIRPCRTGTSSGTRLLACSSSRPTGSRDASGVNSACDSSGATALASFPRAARSARLSCSPPAPEPTREVRAAGLPPRAESSVFTVMATPSVQGPSTSFVELPANRPVSPPWPRCHTRARPPPWGTRRRVKGLVDITTWPVNVPLTSDHHSTAGQDYLQPQMGVNLAVIPPPPIRSGSGGLLQEAVSPGHDAGGHAGVD